MYAVDLFCGAGGLSVGLEMAGFRCICAVERDADAADTYSSAHPHCVLHRTKVEELHFGHLRGEVHLVAGGPPCQPFSSGGKRLGPSDERDMIPEFLRVVREVGPLMVLMENVPGLVAAESGKYLGALLHELEGMGYATSTQVLSAAAFGVPQRRRRLFVAGSRIAGVSFPVATHGPGTSRPYIVAGEVLDAAHPMGEPNTSKVVYAKRPDIRPSPYDGHLFNGGGRPINPSDLSPTVLASAGGNKTPFLDPLGMVPVYHRELLRGGPPREGQVPGARRITAEEAACLQTFPRDYVFAGSRSSRYRQVGNAVPPLLAYHVGRALFGLLCGDSGQSGVAQGSDKAVGQLHAALDPVEQFV